MPSSAEDSETSCCTLIQVLSFYILGCSACRKARKKAPKKVRTQYVKYWSHELFLGPHQLSPTQSHIDIPAAASEPHPRRAVPFWSAPPRVSVPPSTVIPCLRNVPRPSPTTLPSQPPSTVLILPPISSVSFRRSRRRAREIDRVRHITQLIDPIPNVSYPTEILPGTIAQRTWNYHRPPTEEEQLATGEIETWKVSGLPGSPLATTAASGRQQISGTGEPGEDLGLYEVYRVTRMRGVEAIRTIPPAAQVINPMPKRMQVLRAGHNSITIRRKSLSSSSISVKWPASPEPSTPVSRGSVSEPSAQSSDTNLTVPDSPSPLRRGASTAHPSLSASTIPVPVVEEKVVGLLVLRKANLGNADGQGKEKEKMAEVERKVGTEVKEMKGNDGAMEGSEGMTPFGSAGSKVAEKNWDARCSAPITMPERAVCS